MRRTQYYATNGNLFAIKDGQPQFDQVVNASDCKTAALRSDTAKPEVKPIPMPNAKSDGRVYFIDYSSGKNTWKTLPPTVQLCEASRAPLFTGEPSSKPANSLAIDVQGWRRVLLVGSALMRLFLGCLDRVIVCMALPTIANQLNDLSVYKKPKMEKPKTKKAGEQGFWAMQSVAF